MKAGRLLVALLALGCSDPPDEITVKLWIRDAILAERERNECDRAPGCVWLGRGTYTSADAATIQAKIDRVTGLREVCDSVWTGSFLGSGLQSQSRRSRA